LKHILEYQNYSNEDLRDLLGDLEGVGQAKKVRASVWIEYLEGKASHSIKRVILTDDFYASGDPDADAKQVLKKIADGKFEYAEPDEAQKGKDLPDPWGIYLFPREEVQQLGKEYLRDFESYKQMYLRRGIASTGKNGLDAFASDLGAESLKKFKEEDPTWWGGDDMKSEYKVFVAPPSSPYHDKNSMYTLPNPTNVVEYDSE
jgi:hypothetical protein